MSVPSEPFAAVYEEKASRHDRGTHRERRLRGYDRREFVAAGSFISYGPHLPDAYRRIGVYAGRIIAVAKASDLPVMQPTKFELVINLKTAKALGHEVLPTLVAPNDLGVDLVVR